MAVVLLGTCFRSDCLTCAVGAPVVSLLEPGGGESAFLAQGALVACVKTQIHRPEGEAVSGLILPSTRTLACSQLT